MSKTQAVEQPKPNPPEKPAESGSDKPMGWPGDDRQDSETAAGRHEDAPPQKKTT